MKIKLPKAILILNKLNLNTVYYNQWLKKNEKIELVMLFDSKLSISNDNTRNTFKLKYAEVIGIENYELSGLVELEAIKLSKDYEFLAVIAISEIDVLRAARLRDLFGLSKHNELSMNLFREKVAMKAFANRLGIPVPNFMSISNTTQLYKAALQFNYPFIVKPTLYGGAIGFVKIENKSSLAMLAENIMLKPDLSLPMIAEEFISGEMVHCDGVAIDGKVLWGLTSKYIEGCLAFQTSKINGGKILSQESKVHKLCTELINKFLSEAEAEVDFVYHAEFFIPQNFSQPILCEIASRPGGSKIRQMIQFASAGFDTFEAHCLLQSGKANEVMKMLPKSVKLAAYLVLPPKQGTLHIQNSPCPSEIDFSNVKYECLHKNGAKIDSAKHSGDELASSVFTAESENELEMAIQVVRRWLIEKHKIEQEINI